VAGDNYRIAVNVLSSDQSEVLAYFDASFTSPAKFPAFRHGPYSR
jgi:hypothetical protein